MEGGSRERIKRRHIIRNAIEKKRESALCITTGPHLEAWQRRRNSALSTDAANKWNPYNATSTLRNQYKKKKPYKYELKPVTTTDDRTIYSEKKT